MTTVLSVRQNLWVCDVTCRMWCYTNTEERKGIALLSVLPCTVAFALHLKKTLKHIQRSLQLTLRKPSFHLIPKANCIRTLENVPTIVFNELQNQLPKFNRVKKSEKCFQCVICKLCRRCLNCEWLNYTLNEWIYRQCSDGVICCIPKHSNFIINH